MFVVSREIGRANTVNRAGLREPTALHCLTFKLFLVGFAMLAHAGIRGPGKYYGVVVFDRWTLAFCSAGRTLLTFLRTRKLSFDRTQAKLCSWTHPAFFNQRIRVMRSSENTQWLVLPLTHNAGPLSMG